MKAKLYHSQTLVNDVNQRPPKNIKLGKIDAYHHMEYLVPDLHIP